MAIKKTEGSKESGDSKDVEENKVVAALSYVWILFLIPLLAKKESKFCQFHAKQGLVLFLIEVVGCLVFWIPIIGWILFIAVVVFAIIGILKALSGEYWEMPFIGEYAKKINL